MRPGPSLYHGLGVEGLHEVYEQEVSLVIGLEEGGPTTSPEWKKVSLKPGLATLAIS